MPPKPPRPDRKGNRRDKREPSEYEDATLSIDRVTRVVKGGRRMRFRAVVVIGNKKGKVGLGTGKATEVQAAIQKALRDARSAVIVVPMRGDTIPHEVNTKFKSARLRLMPASPGTGIVAGGPLRTILDLAGVKDILAKRFGTTNKLVNAQAAILALTMLRPAPGKAKAQPATTVPAVPSDSDAQPAEVVPVKHVHMSRDAHEKQEREKQKGL